MSRAIRLRPQAEAELIEAVLWYEARGPGLGAEFGRAFEAALSAIERNPLAFPILLKNARRALLRRFPYSIVYTVSEKEIVILACFHAKRNPRRLRERLSDR